MVHLLRRRNQPAAALGEKCLATRSPNQTSTQASTSPFRTTSTSTNDLTRTKPSNRTKNDRWSRKKKQAKKRETQRTMQLRPRYPDPSHPDCLPNKSPIQSNGSQRHQNHKLHVATPDCTAVRQCTPHYRQPSNNVDPREVVATLASLPRNPLTSASAH